MSLHTCSKCVAILGPGHKVDQYTENACATIWWIKKSGLLGLVNYIVERELNRLTKADEPGADPVVVAQQKLDEQVIAVAKVDAAVEFVSILKKGTLDASDPNTKVLMAWLSDPKHGNHKLMTQCRCAYAGVDPACEPGDSWAELSRLVASTSLQGGRAEAGSSGGAAAAASNMRSERAFEQM